MRFLGYSLFNDPLAMCLLFGGIIILAVIVFLYLFIWRKKLKTAIKYKQIKNQEKRINNEKESKFKDNFAASAFSDREVKANTSAPEFDEQKYLNEVQQRKQNTAIINENIIVDKTKKTK